ncbi:hypothetical protein CLPU_5c01060 [Gottschalkia purinilytica]|uniref:Uncharacterized protein n=1 Tax=Gottschalkia purinilytica TaxID=1503 RepID=A0A0L0WB94_GOTPU|nr:hypothetical protein [Gottschalkia purinilytica]KNF08799.1 hypothetical protein CLPU_5c01060 [Gottschalkia purinilytica]
MACDGKNPAQPEPECPEGCCTGDEILCISIPCPITIVLLGLELTLELPCIRLTSGSPLSASQTDAILQQLTKVIGSLAVNLTQ